MLLLDDALADGLPVMFDFLGGPDSERPSPPLGPRGAPTAALSLSPVLFPFFLLFVSFLLFLLFLMKMKKPLIDTT
jgi:hypothetical protein